MLFFWDSTAHCTVCVGVLQIAAKKVAKRSARMINACQLGITTSNDKIYKENIAQSMFAPGRGKLIMNQKRLSR